MYFLFVCLIVIKHLTTFEQSTSRKTQFRTGFLLAAQALLQVMLGTVEDRSWLCSRQLDQEAEAEPMTGHALECLP